MSDYTQGKIYRIRSENTDDVYIGSTCKPLSARMAGHRSDYRKGLGSSSREVLKHNNAYIELIESFSCQNRKELQTREGEIIKNTPNCINKNTAGGCRKEYLKAYREKNKDKLSAYQKEYREQMKG